MRYLVAALTVLTACSPAAVVTEPTPRSPTPSPATPVPDDPTPEPPRAGEFRIDEAMEHARVLSVDIGPRMSGTDGDRQAAEYTRDVLAGLGYATELQELELPQGGVSWNIIGRPPDLDPRAEPYLIVGGHIDSLNGPGANDNATGVGVALEVARAVAADPADLPVVVVAFGAEERQPVPQRVNHVGSRHYVANMPPEEREHLVALVNIDMVGRGDQMFCARMDRGPREATERCVSLGGDLGIPVRERVTPDWSDNGPFLRAGMNAMWLWAGEDPAFHSPQDTFDRLQPHVVEWAGLIALAALRSYP